MASRRRGGWRVGGRSFSPVELLVGVIVIIVLLYILLKLL